MDERTLTALYDTRAAAEAVRHELVAAGVPGADVTIRGAEGEGGGATAGSGRGFWSNLFLPDDDRRAYEEGVNRGGHLLTARVPAGLEDEAIAVIERGDPIDLDERSASWRASGGTGAGAGYAAAGTGATAVLADDDSYRRDTTTSSTTTGATTGAVSLTGAASRPAEGEDKLQVVEERLRVGKREVGRGSVRVRSYVREIPVEEQVELRQERVTIERRPVDRELAPGEATAAFQERSIEAVERGEEAVVSKTARVVEEIAIGKETVRETETVRDTVRRQDVEVEDERVGRGVGTTGTDTTVTGTDRTPLDPTTR